MIYQNEVILQVDPLHFVPSWFKITDKSKADFKNGYVLFFVKNTEDFTPSYAEEQLKSAEYGTFVKIEEMYEEQPVITIAKFIPKTENHIILANEMKKFIDRFYSFKERNPSILFNNPYLPNLEV